jgi:VIT1/CCC1 family predicted Fe2+/Mn2+ transporter
MRKVESEVHHLHEVEEAGESGETPFVVILGVFLFLVPIFALMLGLAFAAYYLVD